MTSSPELLRARTRSRRHISLIGLAVLALPSCSPHSSNLAPQILLFNGAGTSPNDVAAIETILNAHGLAYDKANSQQLNAMGEADLRAYRLLIIPGGNYITMGDNLTPIATKNIHNAVQSGLNYLGICAGGFLAGDAPYNSLNLTAGVAFDFYAVVNQNIHKAAVSIATPETPLLDHYWEDGPQFTGWGEVLGKYPDGTPAVVQGPSGQGWVILSGIHPEAPEKWRKEMTFTTPTTTDNAYAAKLINAALNGTSLRHF